MHDSLEAALTEARAGMYQIVHSLPDEIALPKVLDLAAAFFSILGEGNLADDFGGYASIQRMLSKRQPEFAENISAK